MMRVLPTLLVALLVAAPGHASEAPNPLAALLLTHRCAVVDRLTRAHDYGDSAIEADRYLILSVPSYRGAYVQCLFHDGNTMLRCEAASGYFLDAPDSPRTMVLPPSAIAALGHLGFTTVEHQDNFHRDATVEDPPDYVGIADLMLSALFAGYDVRAATPLTFDAPLAPPDPTACGPAA